MPQHLRMAHKSRSAPEWTLITVILLVAALLRFHNLGDVPKGLEHDEVATWHMVLSVLEGERPIYFEEGYGHEPLFNYLTAIPMSIWGQNWLGERFWAPWLGMFAVAATYALMRRLFNPLVGLSAAGLQATTLWALFFNRLGLRLNLLPFLLCVTAYCFWRGVEDTEVGQQAARPAPSRVAWFAAAGALMGLCFYTYMSGRVVPLLFGAFSIYLVARDLWAGRSSRGARTGWRESLGWTSSRWWPLLVCFAVAVLVMAPLALYLLDRPPETASPQRESQVRVPLEALAQGNLKPILENAWGLLRMWNVDGERYWQLNYSHRPVFVEPISTTLFWVGVLILLWRWKDPPAMLLAIWIAVGMIPSLITSEAPSWPRTMLASPAALALPGIAASAIWGWLQRCRARGAVEPRLCRAAQGALIALLALSWLLTATLTYRDYILDWPGHPRVRYAFQSSVTEAMRYLDATPDSTPVVMAGLSPHDMDPWTEQCTLRRRDLSVRWVDARSAWVVPPGEAIRLIVLDITPVERTLSDWVGLPSAAVLAQGEVVPRGGTDHKATAPTYYGPAFTVYRLDAAGLRQRIAGVGSAVSLGSDPFDPEPLDRPPKFGGLVQLTGYEWLTPPRPGRPAQLLTFWEALRAGPASTVYGEPALRTFVHLLDRDQAVVAGTDVLGAAPDTWLPGDTIVQWHSFTFPSEPGGYAVELGWYVPPDGPRLSVNGVSAPGERILLAPVEIGP